MDPVRSSCGVLRLRNLRCSRNNGEQRTSRLSRLRHVLVLVSTRIQKVEISEQEDDESLVAIKEAKLILFKIADSRN